MDPGTRATVTRSVTKTPRDGEAGFETDETTQPSRVRRLVTGETRYTVWDWVRGAHNPEVAGSNPAPATNASAVSPQANGPQAQLAGRFRVRGTCAF